VLSVLVSGGALAQEGLRTWDSSHGLEQQSVEALAQTPDGYLWLGTSAGLFRFDGNEFIPFLSRNHSGLRSDRIHSLEVDGDRLWIATHAGVSWMEDSELRASDGPELGSRGSAAVPGGGVWVAHKNGPLFATGALDAAEALEGELQQFSGHPLFTRDGSAWLVDVGPGRVLRRSPDGAIAAVEVEGSRYLDLLLELPDGSVLAAGAKEMYRVGPAGAERLDLEVVDARAAVGRPDGSILLASGEGLLVLEPDLSLRGLLRPELRDAVRSLLVDREDNLWVGTAEHGLVRVSPIDAGSLPLPPAERDRSVAAVFADSDGGLWVSAPCAGAVRLLDGREERRIREELENSCVWAFAEHPEGTLWIGTWGGGLARYDLAEGSITGVWGEAQGLDPAVLAIEANPAGGLWLGTEGGLYRLQDEQPRAVLVDGLGQVHNLKHGPDGRLWIAASSGVFLLGPDGAEQVSEVGARDVHLLDEGFLMATYGRGLLQQGEGEPTQLGRELGFEDDFLGRFFESPDGMLWISGNAGLVRVDPAALEAALRDNARVPGLLRLTAADGLPNTECNGGAGSTGFVDAGGVLHVPTMNGVGLVDTGRLAASEPGVPLPRIEWVRTPRRPFEPPPAVLELDADERELEVGFTGLLLSAPEQIRFRYRLGDSLWKHAGGRRTLLLSHLEPGEYPFEVEARLAGADWSEPARVLLRVRPFWYETRWFRWGAILLGLLAVLGLVRYYRRREAVVQALVDERTKELAEANALLAERANRDALTGVASRRLFDDRLEVYWRQARRSRSPLSLLMVDVDRFKALNDRYGHPAGDAFLKQLAGRMEAVCHRGLDLVARYGGEEFAVLLPDTSPDGAERLARQLWSVIRSTPLEVKEGGEVEVTVSVGVATRLPHERQDPQDLVAAADQALYRAKGAGRDRVVSD